MSIIAPQFCPQRLAENRIATANGPTCPHQERIGQDWFPATWATMGETGRLVWLAKNLNAKAQNGR